jgi:hypothetical protein
MKFALLRYIICSIVILYSLNSNGQQRISKQEYIQTYKDLAIREMQRYGIPASITMAQALLESDDGNSALSIESNNHFGIKCHNNWAGETIYHDDDKQNECFRKYPQVADSYEDHSQLLITSKRYSSLFHLRADDYKGWAYGLRKAGYATNPQYSDLLIQIIENNQLYLLDDPSKAGSLVFANNSKTNNYDKNDKVSKRHRKTPSDKQTVSNKGTVKRYNTDPEWVVSTARHLVMQRNEVDYIIAKEGDTFESLSREIDLMHWEFYSYNDLPKDYEPHAGEIIYLQPKRRYAEKGNEKHIVAPGETMQSISQLYALKLRRLYRFNEMEKPAQPAVGDTLWLRGHKPSNKNFWSRIFG